MAPNRITRRGATRRGLAVAAATAALLVALAGCGGGGAGTAPAANAPGTSGTAADVSTPTAAPQSADGVLLDKVLARQEAAVGAYAKVIPTLPPRLARMATYFRAQEQEHVDAVLKAMRGLQSPAEPTPEPLEPGELKSDRERLVFLYEVESATIDEELSAISDLEATWPRSLLASIVANQAQHLTLLRRALGAGTLAQIPVPFENGTFPPPVG
jgi:Ferritin-like domain